MLAAKCSLTVRYDALGGDSSAEVGLEARAKLEAWLRFLEEKGTHRISGTGKSRGKFDKYQNRSEIHTYYTSMDSTLPSGSKKRKFKADDNDEDAL
ncbi:Nucleolar protein 58 [Holothuria leucospilota]|uniref:Nucleolar protein 58 n=1 Tax=Holothuria leucospilota TaxID=206669 RepID=A0A9Q1CIW3_HOLLE|nr:Nucleolar protein 58 [Holothuria leucospilota]